MLFMTTNLESGNVAIKVKFEQHNYSVHQQFQKYIKAQTWQILWRKICLRGGILKLKVWLQRYLKIYIDVVYGGNFEK
jgi:hypothetical protein